MRLRKEKSASSDHKSPVTVEARDDVLVLQITFERVLSQCKKACPRHDQLLRGYINIVAEKGLVLHERIDYLLRSTIRKKILTYLWRIIGKSFPDQWQVVISIIRPGRNRNS